MYIVCAVERACNKRSLACSGEGKTSAEIRRTDSCRLEALLAAFDDAAAVPQFHVVPGMYFGEIVVGSAQHHQLSPLLACTFAGSMLALAS